MTKFTANEREISQLIDLYEKVRVGNDKKAKEELHRILKSSREMRDILSAFITDDELLKEESKLVEFSQVIENDSILPIPQATSKPKYSSWVAIGAAAAAILMILSLPKIMKPDNLPANDDSADTEKVDDAIIATILSEDPSATLNDKVFSDGTELAVGTYSLSNGIATISMSSKVRLTLEAPCELTIHSGNKVTVLSGTVLADSPDRDNEFILAYPNGSIRNSGAEFGLTASANQTPSEVHVFSGQVSLNLNQGSESKALSLQGGDAVQLSLDENKPIELASLSAFPSTQRVKYNNWLKYQRNLREDPTVLAHFDFTPTKERSVLRNITTRSKVNSGTILNPIWCQGRFPNKHALLFDTNENYVELDLSTYNDSFTLQTWIKPERLEGNIQSILSTKAWKPSGHHWEFIHKCSIRVTGGTPGPYSMESKRNTIHLGDWNHLAITFNFENKTCTSFINGKKQTSRKFQRKQIDLTNCTLAGWKPDGKITRGFRGRIDELLIKEGVLSESQIADAYQLGLPNSPPFTDRNLLF